MVILFSDDLLNKIYTGNIIIAAGYSYTNFQSAFTDINLKTHYSNASFHIIQPNPSIFGFQTKIDFHYLNGCFNNGLSNAWIILNSTYIRYAATMNAFACTNLPATLNSFGFSFIILDQQWLYTSDNLYFFSPT
jgi:hypothetical protein